MSRLACYDQAVGAVQTVVLSGDGVPASPKITKGQVAAATRNPWGKLIVELGSGQVWRQLDSKPLTLKPGDRVTVRLAAAGSYLLQKSSGGRSIRVKPGG